MNAYDVIISGAGPAGATCALFLARKGKRVLLIDKEKFPRDKICADNKTWKCLDIVQELGLWDEFTKLPKRKITSIRTVSPSGHEILTHLLEKDIAEKGPWYNVRRIVFDNFLIKACEKEKTITLRQECTTIAPIIKEYSVVGITFTNEKGEKENQYAPIVVGADGSASPIAIQMGLNAQLKGRYAINARRYYRGISQVTDTCELYYLKGICPGYFWIFPVEDGLCNVGIGMRKEDIEKMKIPLEEKLEEVIRTRFSERFQNATSATQIRKWGVSVLPPSGRRWSGNGFVLIGDAGTFAMTFSGEGVGPSMRSGKIAAQTILKALHENDFCAKSLARFDEDMWSILKPEVDGFKWLEFLILNEFMFDFVAKRMVKKPDLMGLSSRMQRDYSVAKEIVNPSTILRLLF